MRAFMALPLAAVALVAADPQAARLARIEAHLLPPFPVQGTAPRSLKDRMAAQKVPGLSLAILQDFKIVAAHAYGFADLASKRPVTPVTRFLAGSISKPVAALGAMKLVEEGKLALDQDINVFLSSWKLPGNDLTAPTPVTLRMLLSHSGGTTVHGFRGYAMDEAVPSVPALLDATAPANSAAVRVDLAPDTQYRYSGGGITIEQLAMTDATGEAFPDLMARRVLKPLGMTSSSYAQPEKDDPGLPTGYRADGSPVKGRFHRYPEMAAAGLWTTPSDLLRAALEMPAALKGQGRVLKADSARAMLTPRFTTDDGGEGAIGLGWFLQRHGGDLYFGHDGADEGFQALLLVNLRTGQGAALMMNSDRGIAVAADVLRAIAAEYHWPGYVQPVATVPLAPGRAAKLAGRYRVHGDAVLELRAKGDELTLMDHGEVPLHAIAQDYFMREDAGLRYRVAGDYLVEQDRHQEIRAARMTSSEKVPSELLQEGRLDEALAAYRTLLAARPGDAGLAETRINQMGYEWFGRGRTKEAVLLFTVNTEAYPRSCNTWDSLGEALVAAGETARARACYEKALAVLPEDTTTNAELKATVRADATAMLVKLPKP
jgi:CubicO group peptidase (beta-lactamase class C family)